MRNSRLVLMLLAMLTLFCLLPPSAQASSGQISGYAWYDIADAQVYLEDSRALNRVVVTLYRIEDGKEVQAGRAVTGTDGAYAFTGLDAGVYRLSVELPEDYQFILPQEGGSVMLPAAGSASTSAEITLSEGEVITTAHIGATKSSSYVKAYVFEDLNANGGRSTVEGMLRGVEIQLYYEYNGEWVSIASSKTDKEGCATFWKLTPGVYRLGASLPSPYIIGPLGLKINGWYNCIPPCDNSVGLSEPFEAPRGGSVGLGIGAVNTGSLIGRVWLDASLDGLYGSDEGGFAGATVSLVSELAGVSRTYETDETGEYRFEKLLEGEYTLSVTLPESAMFTLPDGDSLMTEGYSFTQSVQVQITTGSETAVQPIGVMPVTTLAVYLYHDLNADGERDENEPAFAGATVEVLTDETVRTMAVSDENGLAYLPVLRGGDLEVRCALPDGQVFTVAGAGNDFVAPAASGDIALALTLPHAQDTVLYGGVTLPASISGMLFNDANISGVMEAGETGLSGFAVQAVNMRGEVVAQVLTDAGGAYAFNSLLPAAHTVRFVLVDAYVFSEYSQTGVSTENDVIMQTADYGETAPIALLPGQSVQHVDGGAFRSATVSGSVLLNSGIDSLPVQGGMPGVLVTLLDEYGAPVSDTTTAYTDESGAFYLKGALPGRYSLEYTLPVGAAFTSPMTGNESIVSDSFEVMAETDLNVEPLMAIHTGTLSGILYHDSDLSRSYSDEEPVLPYISITLYNSDLDIAYETRTLDNGQFIFESLRPGAYTITVSGLPEGVYCFGVDDSSLIAPTAASTASAAFTVEIGQQRENCNIAVLAPASLHGRVYLDADNNNQPDAQDAGASGVILTLKSVYGPQSYTLLTDEDGDFSLPAMVPGEYTLHVSLSGDCIPADGNPAVLTDGFWVSSLNVQDGEAAALDYAILRYASITGQVWSMDGSLTGVAGRTIALWQEDTLLSETQTDAEGDYFFGQLKPGQYMISCDLPDETYRFTRAADTATHDSIIRSDVERVEDGVGYSILLTVSMGESLSGCSIGIGALGSLGDTAWLDENGNGYQDAGEPVIPGIEIRLYQYGELVAETVTDALGRYLIRDLYPGAYTVEVTMHAELKATVRQTDYPLVASVLEETDELTARAEDIIVPSGGRNLNCDFGFVLRKKGKYPAAMDSTPATDWDYKKSSK